MSWPWPSLDSSQKREMKPAEIGRGFLLRLGSGLSFTLQLASILGQHPRLLQYRVRWQQAWVSIVENHNYRRMGQWVILFLVGTPSHQPGRTLAVWGQRWWPCLGWMGIAPEGCSMRGPLLSALDREEEQQVAVLKTDPILQPCLGGRCWGRELLILHFQIHWSILPTWK